MERFVDSVLAGLSLEEKLGQLAQYRGRGTPTGPAVPEGGEAEIRAGRVGSFLGVHGAAYTRDMQRIAVEESRARIPLLFAHDIIHGFRTLFPVSLAEAASWDAAAVEHAARIAATEAAAAGLHWTFAPMVDIARDARWGRIVEGAGEDPYLGSVMAAARVRGFQGKDLRDTLTIVATAKHFVAYGAAESGRDYNTVDMSERLLREVYLPPFKAAVDAGVESVMGAFNEV
jgi:beta-glucosidase